MINSSSFYNQSNLDYTGSKWNNPYALIQQAGKRQKSKKKNRNLSKKNRNTRKNKKRSKK